MIGISTTAEASRPPPAPCDSARALASRPHVANKLHFLRGPGEGFSNVILRLASNAKP
jgi:hypothetical protein